MFRITVQNIIFLLQYMYRITVHNILFSYCSICTELQCTIYYFLTAVYVQNYSAQYIIFLLQYMFRITVQNIIFLLQYMFRITVQNIIFLLQYMYRVTMHNILFSYCGICTELQCTIYYFLTAVYVQNYSANILFYYSAICTELHFKLCYSHINKNICFGPLITVPNSRLSFTLTFTVLLHFHVVH
jgi:hypothetical protein